MKSIKELIVDFHSGDEKALDLLTKEMTPLVKKYANQMHFMEYEDAVQELFVTLIESIKHLDISRTQNECLKYMKTAVYNRYQCLCRKYFSRIEKESNIVFDLYIGLNDDIDSKIFQIDFENYVESLKSNPLQYNILFLYYKKNKKQSEISEMLGVSHQYVNRIQKRLSMKFVQSFYQEESENRLNNREKK